MANNRLWAVCNKHNDAVMLTKYYPSEEGGWGGDYNNQDGFFKEHNGCGETMMFGENIDFVREDDERIERWGVTGDPKYKYQKIYLKCKT